jgi:predicted ATPase/class 3 adenylate cyclase
MSGLIGGNVDVDFQPENCQGLQHNRQLGTWMTGFERADPLPSHPDPTTDFGLTQPRLLAGMPSEYSNITCGIHDHLCHRTLTPDGMSTIANIPPCVIVRQHTVRFSDGVDRPGLSEKLSWMSALPTGTVTFLFTDLEGSTRLWDADPVGMRVALARHDEIVRKAIVGAEGHVFSTGGDGFGAVFARAGNAISAAVAAQRELRTEPWPDGVTLRVRMGIHTGEVEERGGDYFGPPVNRAARLMGTANGEQVVVSALTAGLLEPSVGVALIDLGTVHLKGLVEPLAVYGVDAPGAAWVDAPLTSIQRTAGNLPRPHTEFVGDLADLQRRIAALSQARLLTLTGAGGVGKNRAAIEIGWLVIDEFADGVWLVELAPIADPQLVVSAAASALGVLAQPGMSMVESVVDWCAGRRVLIIVDNCEHVLTPAVELVSAIVARCPTVTVLATSREPLGVAGERVVRIESLTPDHGVDLFCARASAADGSFIASPGDDVAIAAICERLDGIPLAIELAAARTRSLSPTELLARLDDRFRLLRGGGRGGLERHQTLRAAVSWSYQLLTEPHRLLFDRLSVFAGGFDLTAAESVCADTDLDELDVIDLLGELVDKSMVIADRGNGATRYRLLETLRQYGEERLEDRGETVACRDRHLAHFRGLTADLDARWNSPAQGEADAFIDAEWGNLRAAHGWAITIGALTQATEIVAGTFTHATCCLRHEHSEWVDRTLDLAGNEGLLDGGLLGRAAWWACVRAEPQSIIELAERGLAIARDEYDVAICSAARLYGLGLSGRHAEAYQVIGELRDSLLRPSRPTTQFQVLQTLLGSSPPGADVRDDVEAFDRVARSIGGRSHVADALRCRGLMLEMFTVPADPIGAATMFRSAIDLADESRSIVVGSWARIGLASCRATSRSDGASATIHDAIKWSSDIHFPLVTGVGLELAAMYFASLGEFEPAAVMLGYLEQQPVAFAMIGPWREQTRGGVANLPNLDQLLAEGAAMPRHEMVAYAIAHLT